MATRILLDTNVYAAWKKGHAGVVARVRDAEGVLFSSVVAGELLFGFRHGNRYQRNRAELEALLDNPYVTLLPVTLETAERFGLIAAALRRKGKAIPTHDLWVAAHAMESGAELLSFHGHFEAVEGLLWSDPSG